jgi:SRSO17 transposase
MAHLYREDGTIETLKPMNGTNWQLAELQTLVGGYIEIVRTLDDRYMVIDEEGKLKGKELNASATRLYLYGRHDVIVGPAVVIDTKAEMDAPEDDDE